MIRHRTFCSKRMIRLQAHDALEERTARARGNCKDAFLLSCRECGFWLSPLTLRFEPFQVLASLSFASKYFRSQYNSSRFNLGLSSMTFGVSHAPIMLTGDATLSASMMPSNVNAAVP